MSENIGYTATLENQAFVAGLEQMRSGMERLKGMVVPLASLAAGFVGAATAGELLKKSLDEAAEHEQLTTSFVTLLGSVDAAKARMKELADFADSTPFELPQVARASRVLETLTNGALSTGKGLTLVGDVASGANRPFEEVAESVGRLYDSLQNGTEIGESVRSLQMMGAISGETKRKLEELQASGAKGPAVWAVAEQALGRFSGGMELQSHTWNGLLSTLHDTINHAFAAFGEPILEVLKPGLEWCINVTKGLAPAAESFGQKMKAAFQTIKQLVASGDIGVALGAGIQLGFAKAVNFLMAGLNGITAFLMQALSVAPKNMMAEIKALTDPTFWGGLYHVLSSIGAGFIAVLAGGLAPLIDKLIGVLNKIPGVHIYFNAKGLADAAKEAASAEFTQGKEMLAGALSPVANTVADNAKKALEAGQKAAAATPNFLDEKGPMGALAGVADKFQENLSKIKKEAQIKSDGKAPSKNGSTGPTQAKVGKEIAADSYAKIGLFVGANSPQVSEAKRTNSFLSRLIDDHNRMGDRLISAITSTRAGAVWT